MTDEHVVELGANGAILLAGVPVQPIAVRDRAVEQALASVEPRVVAATKPAKPNAKPTDTRAVVRDLRARLRVVEREIKARKTLEAERDQILRLLQAAKEKPAPVRSLRATG